MSNVMQVLAKMGSDASCQNEAEVEDLLTRVELDGEIAEAIINKDIATLERQLDVRPDIVCMLVPAEDDDEEKEDDNKDKDSSETENQRVSCF